MMNEKLGIIIVAYNNIIDVDNCVNSILRTNEIGKNLEIIIVDNSPSDDLYNFIKTKYDSIKIIKNTNKGFGEGNNKGVENTDAEYLLFLNPDTIVSDDLYKYTFKKFSDNIKLGMFGVQLIDNNGKKNQSFNYIKQNLLTLSTAKIRNKFGLFNNKKMFISGANIFIRRKVFDQIGRFDEQIFMYYEEKDLTLRMRNTKYKLGFFNDINIVHLEGRSSENIKRNEIMFKSQKYYCNKHNISLTKEVKSEICYLKIKKLVYIFSGKKRMILNRKIKFLEENLNMEINQIEK